VVSQVVFAHKRNSSHFHALPKLLVYYFLRVHGEDHHRAIGAKESADSALGDLGEGVRQKLVVHHRDEATISNQAAASPGERREI